MAETASVQYVRSFTASPPGNNYGYGARPRHFDFDYVQAANGTAADTILLCKLPPLATVDMWRSWFEFSGFAGGATLSIGWQAYTDIDGVPVVLSATGLLSAVPIDADGGWSHGMLVVGTPNDSVPVVGRKVFNNRSAVTLFATINTTAPGAADILNGSFCVKTP